jgi:hypothetical protein
VAAICYAGTYKGAGRTARMVLVHYPSEAVQAPNERQPAAPAAQGARQCASPPPLGAGSPPPDSAPGSLRRKRNRNRVTKLRPLTLNSLDLRYDASKRAVKLLSDLESDLGGADALTSGERQLVQSAAVLGALIESDSTRLLQGEYDAVDVGKYLNFINTQHRILQTLGLGRRARDVTPPSLNDYIARKRAEAEAEAEREDADADA